MNASLRPARPAAGDGTSPDYPWLNGKYVFPASAGQERLWFLRELDPGWSLAYNLLVAFRVDGPIDSIVLQRALNLVVARHESLRTGLRQVEGNLVQVVNPGAAVTYTCLDLGGTQDQSYWEAVRNFAAAEMRRPFTFAEDCMLRVALLHGPDGISALFVAVHHAVADGISLEIFMRELASSYNGFLSGDEPSLPSLPIQYADYVAWQRQWIATEDCAHQRSYWLEKLTGAPLVLELPSDRPRPAVLSARGASCEFRIPGDIYAAAQEFARRRGATMYALLLSAFALLIYRYTSQKDFLVGAPMANRQHPEVEHLIGFLANTLVVRVEIYGNPSIEEFVQRVFKTIVEALAHQEFPFEKIVEELHPERSLSRNPVVQVMFGLQDAPRAALAFGHAALTRMPVTSVTSRLDLSFFLIDDGESFTGVIEYSSDLFNGGTIERLGEHYIAALAAMVRSPSRRVAQVELLTDKERASFQANIPQFAVDDLDLLPRAFASQAARTPNRVALVHGAQHITYRELNRRSNRLAHWLMAQGIRPEDRVAICLDRTPDLVIALLATLKAGAAYVPIDPSYPAERIGYMLDDAQPVLLITDHPYVHLGARIPNVKLISELGDAAAADDDPNVALDGNNLAYVLYTSGSTGRPKGVMVTHLGLANFLRSMAKSPGVESSDVLAAITTVSFDIAALELYLPLVVGARIVLASRAEASDGQALAELFASHAVNVSQATPATWRMLIDAGWRPNAAFKILCGGEGLPQDLANVLSDRGTLWNLYGPTEATIWACRKHMTHAERVTIGKPLDNVSVHVLDDDMQPVPTGVPGELFIGGAGVARGYLRRPALTAARFMPNPFDGRPGATLYRTGDVARLRPDGDVEFIGRIDHQIKLRGFRIELDEIEAVLREHRYVRDAAVVVHGTDDVLRQLVAYVVSALDSPTDLLAQLREHARAYLPDYMVPSAFVPLDELPRTQNGKLDRRMLPPPFPTTDARDRVVPRDDVEARIAAIWEQLLQRERVAVQDNFFDLGGNSLLAGRLVRDIEHSFGVRVPMQQIFLNATIENLALQVKSKLQRTSTETELGWGEWRNGLSDEETEALLNDPLLVGE